MLKLVKLTGAGFMFLAGVYTAVIDQTVHIDWHIVYIGFQGIWSVFWSYAPTPQPETWYNAFFHVAQWVALNPGRSIAVTKRHALEAEYREMRKRRNDELAGALNENPARNPGGGPTH